MKTELQKIVLVLALICSGLNSNGQNQKIYGIATDSGYYKRIVYYDCGTNTDSSVFNLYSSQGEFHNMNYSCTSDPYNGRYFIGAGSDTFPGPGFFTFDIAANTLSRTVSYFDLGDLDYDPFQNRILNRSGIELKSYNLLNGTFTLLANLPPNNGSLQATAHALDPINNQYFYVYGDSIGFHCALFDLTSNAFLYDTLISMQFIPAMLVYDMVTQQYYSEVNDGDIVSIDASTGIQTFITTIPDFDSHLEAEQAVFDSQNGLYMVPYYSSAHQSQMAIIDVNNNSIVSDSLFPQADFNQLFGNSSPRIRKSNNNLTAMYGSSYQWYLNGAVISGATSQNYAATQTGNYSVYQAFFNGNTAYSDSTYISFTGIEDNNEKQININVYPNPVNNKATIDLSNMEGNIFDLCIFNSMGTLQKRIINIKSKKVTIEKQDLNSGLYFFQIENANGIAGKGKFIVE